MSFPLLPPCCTSTLGLPLPSHIYIFNIHFPSHQSLILGWGRAHSLLLPRPYLSLLQESQGHHLGRHRMVPSSTVVGYLGTWPFFAWMNNPTTCPGAEHLEPFQLWRDFGKSLVSSLSAFHLYGPMSLKGNENQLLLIPLHLTHQKAVQGKGFESWQNFLKSLCLGSKNCNVFQKPKFHATLFIHSPLHHPSLAPSNRDPQVQLNHLYLK